MTKLRVPVLLKDAEAEDAKGFPPTEDREIEVESLLPGPVSDRVAIVDLQAGGALSPPLPVPKAGETPRGTPSNPYEDPFTIRWSAFATVLETLKLFESADCLGRTVEWAFRGPQLLVVPQAGMAANAYYHRESRSLQFFSFPRPGTHQVAHTAASHDIVAHETGHAILDGIAPWLYDASSPQSLAIHESVADLTSLFAAVSTRTLRAKALQLTGGDLTQTWLFSAIARDMRGIGGDDVALRSLVDPEGTSPLSLAQFGATARAPEPHAMSVVLSRAFYALMLDVFDARSQSGHFRRSASGARALNLSALAEVEPATADAIETGLAPDAQTQARALWFAGSLVKRLVVRGLDYLPPGDVGFIELARAILACDAAAHPDDTTRVRSLLIDRLLERGIGTRNTLHTDFEGISDPLSADDLEAIIASDWHAMRFVEARRKRLGIPDGVPFDVLPRLATSKLLYRTAGSQLRREVVLKVAWREQESSVAAGPLPGRRWVRRGVSMAFDRATGAVCAFVDHHDPCATTAERDLFVASLLDSHALGPRPSAQTDRSPNSPIAWRVSDGAYELVGTGRALHITSRM